MPAYTIECYFSMCPNHEYSNLPRGVSEPFCMLTKCVAEPEQLECYAKLRDMADVELGTVPS